MRASSARHVLLHSHRYIDAAINGGPSVRKVSHTRLPAFKANVMDAMPRLVERDSSATAGIMLSSFPQEHAAAVRQLQGSPKLQYKYLKAALQVMLLYFRVVTAALRQASHTNT